MYPIIEKLKGFSQGKFLNFSGFGEVIGQHVFVMVTSDMYYCKRLKL